MTVRTYIEKVLKLNANSAEQFAFVINEVMNPELHARYMVSHNTAICSWYQWKGSDRYDKKESKVLDYLVLNEKQPVTYWLSGSNWNNAIESGRLHCLNIISEEEFTKYYGSKEANPTNWHCIEYIDKMILKAHNLTAEDIK